MQAHFHRAAGLGNRFPHGEDLVAAHEHGAVFEGVALAVQDQVGAQHDGCRGRRVAAGSQGKQKDRRGQAHSKSLPGM